MPRLPFFPDPMFGWIFYSVLVGFLVLASVLDYRSLRIPKFVTIPCLALGILFNLGRGTWLGSKDMAVWLFNEPGPWLGALDGLLFSLAGFAMTFAIFFLLWFVQAAKGGDLKLFVAVGAWVGPKYMGWVLIGSVLLVVVITFGMIIMSMLTSGFSETQRAFSSDKRNPGKKRGPTYAISLAIATAVLMLILLAPDLGLAHRAPLPAPVTQAQ